MLAIDNGLFLVLQLVLIGLSGWAFVDALFRPAGGFVATGKLTKPIWLAILAGCLVAALLTGAFGLLGAVAAVASLVYLTDVRPAVRETRPGGPWA